MKSLIRWGATLGLIGSAIFTGVCSVSAPAWALEEEQIVEKLQEIPVFRITDLEGVPLIASLTDGDKTITAIDFFISRSDAEEAIEQLKIQQPDLAQQLQVTPDSLDRVYLIQKEIAQNTQNEGEEGQTPSEILILRPDRDQVEEALSILQTNGEQVQQFPGVPIFMALVSDEFLPNQAGEIPLFLDLNQLEDALEPFKQAQPELVENIKIQVGVLGQVIQMMENSDDPNLDKFVLIPPQETIDFFESLPPEQPQQ